MPWATGFWRGYDVYLGHSFDVAVETRFLATTIATFAKSRLASKEIVVDMGCGTGDDLFTIHEHGVRARGFDGNPSVRELSDNRCEVWDLTTRLPADLTARIVISFDTIQFIPQGREGMFFTNLAKLNPEWVFLSYPNYPIFSNSSMPLPAAIRAHRIYRDHDSMLRYLLGWDFELEYR